MNRSRTMFLLALLMLVLALVSFLFSKETILGIFRQRADEDAAESYIREALSKEEEEKTSNQGLFIVREQLEEVTERIEETEPERVEKKEMVRFEKLEEPSETSREETTEKTTKEEGPSYVPIEDEAYYERGGVVFTPEHAVGRIDCVLEIPCISLRRCVYTGTIEEIEADLDMWFTVSASPDLVPGNTHYAIFGHNHTVQNLSFNRLAEVSLGDYFTLTKDTEVYIYLVTDMLAAERSSGRAAYAYDDSLDPSLCYIFTCGRDYMLLNGRSTRYKDLIVEGTLWRTVPLSVWLGEEAPEEALEKAQESVRASRQAPVLTVRVTGRGKKAGDVSASEASGTAPFSSPPLWAMTQVFVTIGTAAFSAVFFLTALIFRIAGTASGKWKRSVYSR